MKDEEVKELSDEELVDIVANTDGCSCRDCKDDKDKLISRLSEGRKAIEENKTLEESALRWAKIAGQHQAQIEKLVEEIENMKCCNNCNKTVTTCGLSFDEIRSGKNYCSNWQPDGLSKKERE